MTRARALNPDIFCNCANGYTLLFTDRAFDSAICVDVIEHIARPMELRLEIRRVLKPGGRLLLQTPHYPIKRLFDFWHWLNKRRPLADDSRHISKMSAYRLWRDMLKRRESPSSF
ncbi:MAG: class I SAM-dependent methyltransferase [Armatimonadetes bacterium]|nr:class I SAM-dependent methyltransferase [Armatimonadota bacterium]